MLEIQQNEMEFENEAILFCIREMSAVLEYFGE